MTMVTDFAAHEVHVTPAPNWLIYLSRPKKKTGNTLGDNKVVGMVHVDEMIGEANHYCDYQRSPPPYSETVRISSELCHRFAKR